MENIGLFFGFVFFSFFRYLFIPLCLISLIIFHVRYKKIKKKLEELESEKPSL